MRKRLCQSQNVTKQLHNVRLEEDEVSGRSVEV